MRHIIMQHPSSVSEGLITSLLIQYHHINTTLTKYWIVRFVEFKFRGSYVKRSQTPTPGPQHYQYCCVLNTEGSQIIYYLQELLIKYTMYQALASKCSL